MSDLYTDAEVQAALEALRSHVNPDSIPLLDDPEVKGDIRVILDAVAPLISSRAAAKALRDLADEHTTLIPDVLGYKVQAVFTEDILEAAAEAERGFGK